MPDNVAVQPLPLEAYKSDEKPTWCPGCGDFGVLNGLYNAMRQKGLQTKDVVVVSGIGCSSRLPFFVASYGFHGVHGRAMPIATGVKVAPPSVDRTSAPGSTTAKASVGDANTPWRTRVRGSLRAWPDASTAHASRCASTTKRPPSERGRTAVAYGAREAARLGVPLHLVMILPVTIPIAPEMLPVASTKSRQIGTRGRSACQASTSGFDGFMRSRSRDVRRKKVAS